MNRNPYAKPQRKRPRAEATSGVPGFANSSASTCDAAHHQSPSSRSYAASPAPNSYSRAVSDRTTTAGVAEDPNDDVWGDDGDIDWGEVITTIDQATEAYQASSRNGTPQASESHSEPTHQARPRELNLGVSASTCAKATTHSSGLVDPTASLSRTPLGKIGRNPNSSLRTESQNANFVSMKPAPVASTEKQATIAHPDIASLRPASWTTEARTPAPQVPTVASRPQSAPQMHPSPSRSLRLGINDAEDPPLPKPIRFTKEEVQPVQDEYRRSLIQNAKLSQPLLNGWTLFSHQKRAVLRGLLMRRMILALDMGLGKTLIGCVWARAFQTTMENVKIYVICPVSLKKEWERTASQATGLQVQDPKKTKKESASSLLDMEICSWAKVPTNVSSDIERYVVICDEAHSIQSMQSARTKVTLNLVQDSRCVGVLMLTGTPMKNGKPCNLYALLKAVGHPFGRHQKSYEAHFCAARDKSFGKGRIVWDASGSSNLKQLHKLVGSHLLHLTKEECIKELPPQTRVFRHVPVSSRGRLKHNQALNELAKIYFAEKDGSEAVLGAVQRVRMVSSLAKVDATVEMSIKVLEKEPAVVIFTQFAVVAKEVHKRLAASGWEGELLTGETPPNKRQQLVDNFQAGLSPVFVCTFGAGGVGLTLTAAHTIILLDRPWTSGEALQAEDRVRRIGQTKPVTSIWVTAFDLDKQIDSMLEQKKQTSEAVLAQGEDPLKLAAPAKISIFRLLRSVLADRNTLVQSSIPNAPQYP